MSDQARRLIRLWRAPVAALDASLSTWVQQEGPALIEGLALLEGARLSVGGIPSVDDYGQPIPGQAAWLLKVQAPINDDQDFQGAPVTDPFLIGMVTAQKVPDGLTLRVACRHSQYRAIVDALAAWLDECGAPID